MNKDNAMDLYSAWEEYVLLEEDFIKYLRYVPLTKEHNNVWSLYLGDLLIRIGSILDSFFKRAIFSSELDNAPNIEKARKKYLKDINMKDYKEVFEPFYQLSSKTIFELRTFKRLYPFFSWKFEKSESPIWWKAYNSIKHDRFNNQKEATLESTLNALGALFIINVIHLAMRPVLVDYNTIRSSNPIKFYSTKTDLRELLSRKEPVSTPDYIFAKTKIFIYVFEGSGSVNEQQIKYILFNS